MTPREVILKNFEFKSCFSDNSLTDNFYKSTQEILKEFNFSLTDEEIEAVVLDHLNDLKASIFEDLILTSFKDVYNSGKYPQSLVLEVYTDNE